jgi:hypothetical protein
MRIIKFLTFIFFVNCVFSQKLELGKVTIEELKQKNHTIDPNASAAIIFKKGMTSFRTTSDGEWILDTKTEYKIKIFNKEGLEQGNQSFAFYTGGTTNEKISISDAATYNLVGDKMEKTKLKSEGEFVEKINESWSVKKLSFPAVSEGSIIEFSVTKSSPYVTHIDDFYFQTDMPIDNLRYILQFPEYFKFNTIITGYEQIKHEHTGSNHIYTATNVPAIKDEDHVINSNNYTSILKLELSSISYPGEIQRDLSLSWDDVVRNIFENQNFGGELKKRDYFDEDLKKILAEAKSNKEKIAFIYDFVKSKMTWNDNYGIYTTDGVKKAYKQNTGNVAEINLILVAMLRSAGIEANPIIISTRSNGVAIFPNRTAYNYVAVVVEDQESLLFLDATEKKLLPGMLPLRALNWVGRVIRDNGSSYTENLYRVQPSKENNIVLATLEENGVMNGKLRKQITDYYAYLFRNSKANINKEMYIESLENKYQGLEIGEYKVDNVNEIYKPIVEEFSFVDKGNVEIIGNKIFMNPLTFLTIKENPFKAETRKYPIDFNFPAKDSYNFSIKIPAGYKVDFLPEPVSVNLIENLGHFKFNVSYTNNQIQAIVNYEINTFMISEQDYGALKQFYEIIVNKLNEKIILSKI